MLALRLDPDTEARLDHVAKVSGRSKHFYATTAIQTHLQLLEAQFLTAQEQAEVQALVAFDRVDLALAGELDPDLLTAVEHDHYFDANQDKLGTFSEDAKKFYEALGQRAGAVGTNDQDEIVWRHSDGTMKPFPPA
jgi:RHH-type transcriptional regulator, rel operon repressor / antitoxin RelB